MTVIGLNENEQKEIFKIVASVLHMGNIGFTEEEGHAKILKPQSVAAVAQVRCRSTDVYKLIFAYILVAGL